MGKRFLLRSPDVKILRAEGASRKRLERRFAQRCATPQTIEGGVRRQYIPYIYLWYVF